jgi:uncharacterized protein
MEPFKRHIYEYLNKWKTEPERKPLILRGGRQVGKTTLIQYFAQSFPYRIFLNLEKNTDKQFFNNYNEVKTLTDALFLSKNIPSDALGKTLLFIDEIQESPEAIGKLRYFYEEVPELHVIAAGSLLEFAMKKVKSFPVGRVEYLYMYPLNFSEYLDAMGHQTAKTQLDNIPVKEFAHETLLELFNRYAIIGGMPEIIQSYLHKRQIADLPKIYESIWETYKTDVEKYAGNETERKIIKHVINTAHLYIDQRIKFQNFGNSNYRSREIGEAIRNLDSAKIIQLVYPTTVISPPIIPDIRKSPKLQFLDTGIVNYTLGIQAEMLGMKDLCNTYRGAVIPHIIVQEMLSLNTINNKKIHFWIREKRQSSAEVDIVINYADKIIPIEVKSGSTGSLKSLHQFIDNSPHKYAIRIYGGKFEIKREKTPSGTNYLLMNLPYYLGTKIYEYIDFFINKAK